MSLEDRLSFGEGPLGGPPPEPEEQPEGKGKANRAFVFIAIAMGGLILLGVLALIGALTMIVPQRRAQQAAAVTQTIVAATMEAQSWTPTPTEVPPTLLPTYTAAPPSTNTPVPTPPDTRVVPDVGDESTTPMPTATRAASAEWGAETPSAGLGGLGGVAIAVGLAGLVFAVRRLRLRH